MSDHYDYEKAVRKGLIDGKDEYSEGTSECNQYPGCLYQLNERCIYHVSKIQQQISRACYNDIFSGGGYDLGDQL